MNYAKGLYHRIVPARIRNPIGLFRRDVADRLRRVFTRVPLPPRELLANIQMTPWAREYLGVGKRSANSILRQLESLGISLRTPARVLDFGCGSGRILRYFRRSGWDLYGCDIDRDAVDWSRRTLPFASLAVCAVDPPLPYPDAHFDVVLSISVFTHFSPDEQKAWRDEIARVLKPGALLILTTMGPSVLGNFPQLTNAAALNRLTADGSLFVRKDGPFNASASFHTARAIVEGFSPPFFLMRWLERGLDGFQDLSVLRRK